jgi:hypothetical protein
MPVGGHPATQPPEVEVPVLMRDTRPPLPPRTMPPGIMSVAMAWNGGGVVAGLQVMVLPRGEAKMITYTGQCLRSSQRISLVKALTWSWLARGGKPSGGAGGRRCGC